MASCPLAEADRFEVGIVVGMDARGDGDAASEIGAGGQRPHAEQGFAVRPSVPPTWEDSRGRRPLLFMSRRSVLVPSAPAATNEPFRPEGQAAAAAQEPRRLPRPDTVALAPVRRERLDVDDPVLGEDPGAELLGEIEIVLVQAVLGVLAAAGHALAAKLAADAVGPFALEIRVRGRLPFLPEINGDVRQAVGRFAPDLGRCVLHQRRPGPFRQGSATTPSMRPARS